jgi:hypothetical protein
LLRPGFRILLPRECLRQGDEANSAKPRSYSMS